MNGFQRRWQGWGWRPAFSDIHPLTFLVIYLLAIPIFGAIYETLPPPSFYAPYTRYEPSAKADADQVAADLYAGIETALARPSASTAFASDWRIDPGSIGIRDVTVEADHLLSFTVQFKAVRETPAHSELKWSLHAVTPMRERIVSFPSEGPVISRFVGLQPQKVASAATESLGFSDEMFASALFKPRGSISISPGLSWSAAQEGRLEAFAQGRQGDPSYVSGDFWRMIYFSSITITTVGYGDIIPLTPLSRALTACEAVLGWVLAGLFLNAVAHRLSRASF